ncbi:MAG: TonB-dependent receptor [Symploca sp. SIO2G7]|nr:TonB-dependent receptor [Symploca sp. SIO2G7]
MNCTGRTFTDESGFLTIPLLSIDEINQNSDELLPRFAAQYRFNPNLTAYGSISRGFRPAGVNVTPFSVETATFEAETSWNYELGLKSSWLDNSLFANLAIFYNPVNNFQFIGFQPATRTLFVGNADVDIFGAELELSANPVEGLDLIAGLGIVDTEFQNSADPFTGNSFDGNQVPFAPRLTYNLAAQYRSPDGLFGRIELNGFGETQLDNDNSFEQDPYAIVNVRLGYETDSVGIYLFANNLFDTRYLTQVLTTPPERGAFGAPATFGLQVRSQF